MRLTTPKDQSFVLNLPAGSADKYQTAIAAIPPGMRTSWRYYRVEDGDTLASIAHKYHSSPSSITEANGLPGGELTIGAKLVIPVTPGRNGEATTYSKRPTRYKIRKGDTLESVAEDFQVPADKLRRWNHLRGTALAAGRTLLIYKPVGESPGGEVATEEKSATPAGKHKSSSYESPASAAAKYHKVKRGETLSSIAESYQTTVDVLKRENPKMAANLRAGDVLVIKK